MHRTTYPQIQDQREPKAMIATQKVHYKRKATKAEEEYKDIVVKSTINSIFGLISRNPIMHVQGTK